MGDSGNVQTDGWMAIFEGMVPLVEMCAGYRERCKEAGFSDGASEQMAVQLHGFVMLKGVGRYEQSPGTG